MESKNTCVEVFGKRLKELRKANGYMIEQFAEAVGISKSTVGYYENNNRMPDIEILSRIADVLKVSADYLIGKTNTTAMRGKMKTVCDFTGLSDTAVEYLAELVKNRDYGKLSVVNHLFDELSEDYAFYAHETRTARKLRRVFSVRCSCILIRLRLLKMSGWRLSTQVTKRKTRYSRRRTSRCCSIK